MSLFDFLSGKKFQQGMAAGAKPFAAKFEQHAEALNRLEKTFGDQWKKTKDVADKILDSIEATERERLYGLYTQIDIKELKPEYKEFLLATLYTLSSEGGNEFQQTYIRSVQRYLGITTAQTNIDFSGLENIDRLSDQKAVYQSCVEYLLLKHGDFSFFEQYEETLFCHFSLKESAELEICENILLIYTATGPLGLSEKYGFVPKIRVTNNKNTLAEEEIAFEKLLLEETLAIAAGEELVIEGKEIELLQDMVCDGKLILKKCLIYYNGDDIKGQIRINENSTLELSNCSFIGKNNPMRELKEGEDAAKKFGSKSLIAGSGKEAVSKVIADECFFLNCLNCFNNVRAVLNDSIIRYTEIPLYELDGKKVADSNFLNGNALCRSELKGCLIEANEKALDEADKVKPCLRNIKKVANCTFKNMASPILLTIMNPFNVALLHYYKEKDDYVSFIEHCYFINCEETLETGALGTVAVNMSHCVFENCSNIINVPQGSKISHCKFIDCGGKFISSNIIANGVSIEYCVFFNVKNPDDNNFHRKNYGLSLSIAKNNIAADGKATIHHCAFDGINHAGFISSDIDTGESPFHKKIMALDIYDCDFKHCVSGVIDVKNSFLYNDDIVISINNCTGLENTGGGQAENINVKLTGDDDHPIGARLEENDVGVPFYQN